MQVNSSVLVDEGLLRIMGVQEVIGLTGGPKGLPGRTIYGLAALLSREGLLSHDYSFEHADKFPSPAALPFSRALDIAAGYNYIDLYVCRVNSEIDAYYSLFPGAGERLRRFGIELSEERQGAARQAAVEVGLLRPGL